MNRVEFMRQLEMLLSDVTPSERGEALQFYNDYFDDAGAENEQEVIKALGSPAKVAATIKTDLSGNSAGEFTENGYRDFQNQGQQVVTYGAGQSSQSGNPYGNAAGGNPYGDGNPYTKSKKDNMSGGTIVLIILLCLFASPILIPLALVVLALIIAFLAILFALIIAAAAITFSLIVTGVVLFVTGIVKLVVSPFGGLCLIGIGLVCAGIGAVFSLLAVWICAVAIPAVFRLVVNICRKPFAGRRGETA